MVTLLYSVRDLGLVWRPQFFQTQMTEGKHLNHVQVTDFSDVLIIITFPGRPSAALVQMKMPHLCVTESQADENC